MPDGKNYPPAAGLSTEQAVYFVAGPILGEVDTTENDDAVSRSEECEVN